MPFSIKGLWSLRQKSIQEDWWKWFEGKWESYNEFPQLLKLECLSIKLEGKWKETIIMLLGKNMMIILLRRCRAIEDWTLWRKIQWNFNSIRNTRWTTILTINLYKISMESPFIIQEKETFNHNILCRTICSFYDPSNEEKRDKLLRTLSNVSVTMILR